MFSRRLKNGYFAVEGLNSFATVYYFYYFYFFMQKQFGFDNKANLAIAALNGGAYAVCSFFCGKFAQRFGYYTALKLGLAIMALAMAAGLVVSSAPAHILVMTVAVLGMSFTWPTLEALISEGESRSGVQHMVGVYNVVWAATAALGSFSGGALLAVLGFKSLFLVPMGIQLVQLGLTVWLEAQARRAHLEPAPDGGRGMAPKDPEPLLSHPPSDAQAFLRMAWLANPFAYIAINTLVAVMPGLALRLELSTTLAGFCASTWCFARFGAFAGLWLWSGWHYRFRWLVTAYVLLAAGFTAVLLAPSVTILVLAQLAFGSATGLIYSSSLFYSMDISETKGEHGGFHEAAIGVGNFAGPALGAAALQFLPKYPAAGALAVTALLLSGLVGLVTIRHRSKRN
jgi:predicted MFS family arabinose efflux permease